MKAFVAKYLAGCLFVAAAGAAHAQAPSGAPAGSTGLCKDGTYSDAPSKRGACAGHKGVKEWYQADAAAPTAARTATAAPASTAPVPTAAQATAAAAAASTPAPSVKSAPAGRPVAGGAGQVWVNSASKVYHCEGSKYYGKTKAGAYMTEAAAVAAGNHADHGKACKAA